MKSSKPLPGPHFTLGGMRGVSVSSDRGETSPGGDRSAAAWPVEAILPRTLILLVVGFLPVLLWSSIAPSIALAQGPPFKTSSADSYFSERRDMVDVQVRRRGINEPSVLAAMETVPRHLFVPKVNQFEAYHDTPVSISPGQTLSQAYVSARMIALLDLDGDEKVLEIGTGSGYDAALLSRVAKEVYTIEIDGKLGGRARDILTDLGYGNVKVRIGDGYRGWPEEAPFDAILITAAPERLPQPLMDQLKVGGKMVVAVGKVVQELQVITKNAEGPDERRKVILVNLAPMTGEVQKEN